MFDRGEDRWAGGRLGRRRRSWCYGVLGLLLLAVPRAGGEDLPGTLALSGSWRAAEERNGTDASDPALGRTWQRRVELPPGWQERLAPSGLALLVPQRNGAEVEVEAGGRRVAEERVESNPQSGETLYLFVVPPEAIEAGGNLRLALRGAFAESESGAGPSFGNPGYGLVLGDRRVLTSELELFRLRRLAGGLPVAVLAVFILVVGVYHLHLYGRRRNSEEYLWFGLAAIVFSIATYAAYWAYPGLVEYPWNLRLLEAAIHLQLALLLQFFFTYLSRPIPRMLQAYQVSEILLAGFCLFAPTYHWVMTTDLFRWIWGIPGWLAMAVLLVREVSRGWEESRTIGLGGAVVILAGGAEWVAHVGGFGTTLPAPVWAFAFFALIMALSLSQRFQLAHQELEGLRNQLERMVADRTAELSVANDQLKSEISERQLAEGALRMLERAAEQSIDGIVVTNLERETHFVNHAWAELHGYEVFEVVGRPLALFHTPSQLKRELAPALDVVEREGAFDGEIGHCYKDGTKFPTWMSITLLTDPEKGPVGFVALVRDISERRQAEEERDRLKDRVQQSKKLRSLGGLASGIAHDYNNLLTGVLGNATLLQRELEPEAPASERIRQIERAAERAGDLTSQLLAYAGEDPMVRENIDAARLLAEMRGDLERLVPPGSVLKIELASELPEVLGDPGQLRRAIHNLVSNSVDAVGGSGGGTLRISTADLVVDRAYLTGAYLDEGQPEGRYLRIEIADDGVGIDEATRARMFDPFFSTRPSARGLGLATVLGIVRGHRGVIKVDSEPGQGSRFEILLPAASTLDGPSPLRSVAEIEEGSGTILVVDDEAVMREVSESILAQNGFEVLTAADGTQAVEYYRRYGTAIRLVLLDRTMPGMDGKQVLREIHSIHPSALVLLMSGYSEREVLRGLEGERLAGFLQKPFRPDDLLRKVQDLLESGGGLA